MAETIAFVTSFLPRALPWAGRLATVVVLAILAWLGAGIFWSITTPVSGEPSVAVDTDPARAAQAVASRHIFGEAPALAPQAVATGTAASTKLLGVVAPSGKGQAGIAILSLQGKPAAALREGDEIAPGVTLHRVLTRSVEINENGATYVLNLAERGKS